MNDNVMKVVTGLLVLGVAWTLGSVSGLQGGHREQEVHIQQGISDIDDMRGLIGSHGERITRLESGMAAKLDALIEKVDSISKKLEKLDEK